MNKFNEVKEYTGKNKKKYYLNAYQIIGGNENEILYSVYEKCTDHRTLYHLDSDNICLGDIRSKPVKSIVTKDWSEHVRRRYNRLSTLSRLICQRLYPNNNRFELR